LKTFIEENHRTNYYFDDILESEIILFRAKTKIIAYNSEKICAKNLNRKRSI